MLQKLIIHLLQKLPPLIQRTDTNTIPDKMTMEMKSSKYEQVLNEKAVALKLLLLLECIYV